MSIKDIGAAIAGQMPGWRYEQGAGYGPPLLVETDGPGRIEVSTVKGGTQTCLQLVGTYPADSGGWTDGPDSPHLLGHPRARAFVALSRPDGAPVDLYGVNLSSASLVGARLERAWLEWANLSGASAGGANLKGAHLGNANLAGADMRRANLAGAALDRARFDGAALDGAVWPHDVTPPSGWRMGRSGCLTGSCRHRRKTSRM